MSPIDRFTALLAAARAWSMALAVLLVALVPSVSLASGCTAMWAMLGTNQLAYYNTTTNQWITQTAVIGACGASNCNALAGRNSNGLLYFVDRTTRNLLSFNPNTGVVSASLGTIPAPPAPATATNILGATFDNSDRLFVYATAGGASAYVTIAQIDVTTSPGATLTSWTQVRTTAGATPTLLGSGDMNVGNDNVAYIISNTNPPTYHQVNLTPGASFGQTNSPPLTITGANGVTVAGVAVNPVTQTGSPNSVYFSGSAPTGSTTFLLDRSTGIATQVLNTAALTVADMGNCPVPPDVPTVAKVFSPDYKAGGITNRTATLTITFGNTNNAPVWLMQTFSDVFPAGMVVATTPGQSGSCVIAGNTINTTAGSSSMTFASGGKIPAGGCSVSFAVSATASLTGYTNTIPAGSVSTTAGANTVGATDTLTVGTDFSLAKQVRAGTTVPLQNTTSVGALQTMQYVLTISNSTSGGTGSLTFTDTLPTLITPVLSITAAQTGGGACATATAVVGGRTVVTGTVTNALAGSTCTVTVTARGSSTVGTFANTATIAVLAATADPDATDNNATATVTITPITNITIVKTNGLGGTAVAGSTVVYTLTVANLGPSSATPSFLTDPTVPGLNCTNVTCSAAGTGAACPSAGISTTMAYLTGSGIQINTFSANQTLTFAVTCGVTATGLP